MFQKCPKCNGEGKVDSNRINEHLSIFFTPPVKLVYEKDPCPICLGECIIHSEQGVPPSKVKNKAINDRIEYYKKALANLPPEDPAGV